MEEAVGKLWDRFITRAARKEFPEAAVTLQDLGCTIGVFFRALGGDGGLRVEAASPTRHGARRRWLERVAGVNRHVELAWVDGQALYLPPRLAVLPDRALNRELYLWLAALAAESEAVTGHWFIRNQHLCCRVLQRYPGLAVRYRRLSEAHLALRPDPASLPSDEARQELAIRAALSCPGAELELPPARRPPQPVLLWLHPEPPVTAPGSSRDLPEVEREEGDGADQSSKVARRRGERVAMPEGRRGLVFYRFETLFGWAEYVKVDRSTDEEDDLDAAAGALEDLDVISVARDASSSAKRLRFDLDLPAPASDDIPLGPGLLFPEWDYRRQQLRADHCCVQPMLPADARPGALPSHLRHMARRLRAQFEALVPSPAWFRGQPDGAEVDLDAYLYYSAQRARGCADAEQGLYRDFRQGQRDMACLVLADLSLSTDTWINNDGRVIDVIRDALYLFAEALNTTGDRFALYGFSSRHRQHVRLNWLKGFDEPYGPAVRGRLAAIRPGFYTRMGAAVRYAAKMLARQNAAQRLLLILTDGKPNDLDQYEGRYGAEDTRQAVVEARRQGLRPFCVTVDDEAAAYLPHLFGSGGFVVIRHPSELPRRLPLLYARLTR